METEKEFEPWLRERLAENLRRVRLQKEVSQETLGAECGLHRTYISQVERAVTNITLDNLQRIAMVLEVEPAELLRKQPA
ncbi:XRE family transcriptional regulator [Ralstonia solanacearum]|uniref:helix-turn-helix domain-containing protein n=1 Tax=Ralstonia solanacearum TaxID=305 RepID=UPI000E65F17F|nr:helix-turn-helix transcriptional regulator [Ralstonia solanacearum]RIJ85283.1 XRE family transcriptional regulator [Ralstonia solanacearum]